MKVFALGVLSLLASCGGGNDGKSTAASPQLTATVTPKAYSGLSVNAFVRSVLRLVSDTTDIVVFQATIDSAITDLAVPIATVPV